MSRLIAATIFSVICLPALLQGAEPGEPYLADEITVFAEEDQAWRFNANTHWPLMRLSPDGKKLLYLRRTKEDEERYAVMLRDLASGKDETVPISSVSSQWANLYPRINPFDSASKRLVLMRIDEASPADSGIVIWEIGQKEVTAAPLGKGLIVAKFHRSGSGLIVNHNRRFSTAPFPELKSQPIGLSGILWSNCPTQDLIAVYQVNRPPGERAHDDLILYDLKGKQQVASLPLDNGSTLDDLETKWTRDGRFLFFADHATWPVVKAWDRQEAKLAAKIEATDPVGPGPTPSTMVMKRFRNVTDSEWSNIVIADAKTGEQWLLGEKDLEVQDARAGRVVYLRHHTEGEPTVHVARIVMPNGEKKP